jgi:hypothetical protein
MYPGIIMTLSFCIIRGICILSFGFHRRLFRQFRYFLRQSAARLRGLAACKVDSDGVSYQSIHYLVPPTLEIMRKKLKKDSNFLTPTVKDIIKFTAEVQQDVEKKNNFFSRLMLIQHKQKYFLGEHLAFAALPTAKSSFKAAGTHEKPEVTRQPLDNM